MAVPGGLRDGDLITGFADYRAEEGQADPIEGALSSLDRLAVERDYLGQNYPF